MKLSWKYLHSFASTMNFSCSNHDLMTWPYLVGRDRNPEVKMRVCKFYESFSLSSVPTDATPSKGWNGAKRITASTSAYDTHSTLMDRVWKMTQFFWFLIVTDKRVCEAMKRFMEMTARQHQLCLECKLPRETPVKTVNFRERLEIAWINSDT